MTTELCAYTCDACDIARRTGVTRIELCAAPFEGGTTPSAGLIRYARSLPGLRLSVMIRPRGGDFCYTDAETALMAEEIRCARACGADGVVLGVLTPDGEVDETRTAHLVREAEGMEVTFHRAFDMTRDPRQALEAVIRTGCRRVLTSGGRNTAQEGVGTLRALAAQAARRIVGTELAVACAERESDHVLVLSAKKGCWLRTVPAADNAALWLLDMIRRAAAGLPQAEGTGFLPAGQAAQNHAETPPQKKKHPLRVLLAVLLLLALAALGGGWYLTGGDLAALPERLKALRLPEWITLWQAHEPKPGARLI